MAKPGKANKAITLRIDTILCRVEKFLADHFQKSYGALFNFRDGDGICQNRFESEKQWPVIALLKRWGSKLLSSTKNFEKDHAAVMAMIGDFKDKRFREIPPDPRQIDPERLRQIRERLTNKYAYQWRSTEANGELVDALFHTIRQADGTRYGLGPAKIALNEKGESPGLNHSLRGRIQRNGQDEFQVYYYITARSMNVFEFITRYDHAVLLLGSLLPDFGFTIHSLSERTIVRLEKDGESGPWIENSNVALGLVLALLFRLEEKPEKVKHWQHI